MRLKFPTGVGRELQLTNTARCKESIFACTRSGFTIVEILVVVAIIGILAALLFPVFSSARESARRSKCASNLKQIGMACLAYAGDHRDILPPSRVGNVTWDRLLLPYIRDERVFKCPSDFVKRRDSKPARSYSLNDQMTRYYLAHPNPAIKEPQGMRLGDVPSSSQYVLMTEIHEFENIIGGRNGAWVHYDIPKKEQYVHGNSDLNNFLFYDGHVRLLSRGQLDKQSNYMVFAE